MPLRRSLAFSFIDRYSGLLTGVISSMILARLLTPAEVGIFSIVMVLLALANTLRDMGAGQYLLQEKELTPDRIRAVWTVQLSVGALIACVVALASQPVAAFYAEPRMVDVMLVLAVNYLINPLGSITYAWLMRELRFDSIAVIRFTSTMVSAITSVTLAWRGWGPISLAWGSLLGTLATAAVSVLFRPKGYPWLPGFTEVRRVLAFGTRMTSTSIIQTIAIGFPEFFLAKVQGMAASGFYSRANGLVAMFHRLVSDAALSVAVAMFSKKSRADEDMSAAFIKAMSYVTVLGWAFALNVALLAYPIVRVLYGDQWDQAVDLTRLLALAMVLGLPIKLCHSALQGAGRAAMLLKVTLLSAIVTIVLAAAGAWFGLLALGFALIVSNGIATCLWLAAVKGTAGFSWRHLAAEMRRSLWVALASAVAPLGVVLAGGLRPAAIVVSLGIGLVGSAVGFAVAAHFFKHPFFAELARLYGNLRNRVRQGPQ